MNYTRVTDEGAEAMADMLCDNETVKEVNMLFNTGITEEQKESLRIRVNDDGIGGTVLRI